MINNLKPLTVPDERVDDYLDEGFERKFGDPADRMLISHARLAELTLVTSDSKIQQYPVKTLW